MFRLVHGFGFRIKKNTGAIWKPHEVQSLAPLRATCRQPASTGEEAQCSPTVQMFQVQNPSHRVSCPCVLGPFRSRGSPSVKGLGFRGHVVPAGVLVRGCRMDLIFEDRTESAT